MLGSIVRYPIIEPDSPPLEMCMVFNDSFIITNIARKETINITILAPKTRMRPVPPKRKDMPTSVTYTAQNMCNKDEFEEFYLTNLGKSVKMNFEGRTYYGYLSDFVIGEYDVTFNFTYTSNIADVAEDPGFPSL